MPPKIALLICILLIFFLFWMDREKTEGISNAIWIPFIWLFITGSRFVSQWMDLKPGAVSDALIEGSPVDRAVFTVLILAGVWILGRRKIDWKKVIHENPWIWGYFLLGALSFVWSEYPFVSFKRWVKALGNIVMILIILTEDRPYAAMGVILRRLAFVLLPLSVLFIKYYPDLGRDYHMGQPMFTGVSNQKNGLGQTCLVTGIYFSWALLFSGSGGVTMEGKKIRMPIYFIMLPMIAWLLHKSNSATSLACLIGGISILVVGRHPAVVKEPQRLLHICIASIAVYGLLEYAFDVKEWVFAMLGRRPDLTTRVPMWEDLLLTVRNPIFGFGYESFWLGEQGRLIYETYRVGQAHNGYLEMYLNLGLSGLLCVLGWIVSGIRKVGRYFEVDYPAAMLRFCLIVVIIVYNYTEASFYGISRMWLLLLFAVMSIPKKGNGEGKRRIRAGISRRMA